MQTFTVQHFYYPSGGDFGFSPEDMRDLHVCHTDTAGGGGSIEFQLASVEEMGGQYVRATFKNLGGSHDVLLNAAPNEQAPQQVQQPVALFAVPSTGGYLGSTGRQ